MLATIAADAEAERVEPEIVSPFENDPAFAAGWGEAMGCPGPTATVPSLIAGSPAPWAIPAAGAVPSAPSKTASTVVVFLTSSILDAAQFVPARSGPISPRGADPAGPPS